MTPLLRCLGNICSGADEYSLQACDNPRLLHTLGTFLDSAIRHILKECLWVLSNMAGKWYLFNSLHAGQFFMLLLSSADFFQNLLFQKKSFRN